MKPPKNIKPEALTSIGKWKKALGMKDWDIMLRLMDGPSENGKASAVIDFSTWVYKSADISLFDPFYTLDADQRDEAILHELCHAFLAPLTAGVIQRMFNEQHVPQFMFDDYHERTVQELANLVLRKEL
jgi:hypothetical protein